jgi:hypothetical protein
MPSPPGPHRYRLFGLTLQSAIPLPELVAEAPGAGGDVDVVIERGPVAIPLEAPPVVRGLRVTSEGGLLRIKGTGRYAISDGSRIIVDADPGALDRNVRLFLLGSAMGVLLHQRGIVPLHANAIDLNGRAIGFLGRSGSGKSTLAAAFHDQGWRVLSDDVCAVTEDHGGFLAQPGIPRLRLWRDAIERSGRVTEGYERAFDDVDKYTVGIAAEAGQAVPLTALYLLASPGEGDFAIRRLAGAEAVDALMANTYRGAFVALVGDRRRYFETCVALSRQVPLFELARPWDGARVAETVVRVAAHLASLG